MKGVSDGYKVSMAESLRNRSFVRVTVDSIDREAEADGQWMGAKMSYSSLTDLGESVARGDPPATLELNYWDLDGTFAILQDGDTAGYVSSSMSDANGDIDTAIMRPFTNTHPITHYTVVFDERGGEWPVNGYIRLETTMEVTPGHISYTPMDRVGLNGLTQARNLMERPITATDMISVTFTKLLPYRRARIDNFIIGASLAFDSGDLISTDQSHDVDPLSRRLPSENLEFTIIDFEHRFDPENPGGIYEYIHTRSPVTITHGYEIDDGIIEWLEPDGYILNAKPVFDNGRVTFRAGGLIASLTGSYYKDTIGTKNLKAMAEAVLADAAAQGYIPSGSWDIDAALADMSTIGVLPIGTHAEALQIIAHAARSVLYTDSSNTIHITPFTLSSTVTNDLVLDYSTVSENSQVLTRTDLLRAVSVSEYGYVDGASAAETLYSASTMDEVMHIEIPAARDVTVTVTGAAVLEQHIYAQAVDLVMEAGSKSVQITGIIQTKTEMITTVDVNSEGETDGETNCLITNDAMRDALSAHVRAYLSLRNTYEVTYRGNAELETRDVIKMETRYSGLVPVLVLTDTLRYSGALSGSIKGKGLM